MKPGLVPLFGCLLLLGACAAPRLTGYRQDPPSEDAAISRTLARLRGIPWIRARISESYAYVVFPTIGKGGAGFGGAVGKGKVYEQGKLVGTAAVTQVTFGLQLGGQVTRGILLFPDRRALKAFQFDKFSFTGQASAVLAVWGLSVDVVFSDQATLITLGPVGLMYDASVGGMFFRYRRL